ncbi:uncharacterized protein BXZ73DRAFT_107760 [Epithele typhae]|uniref:uncharacterized protein n=1 Tax=Epithele typhae TaxID=378194 RepID=UPI00200782F4|nr:uncharacterized protein BXZ73DRAFT_107760 [Epithele typhae]KAH9911928.1 hypothetical protein BXZ73DRAFT_107760 [Epithele typhae]
MGKKQTTPPGAKNKKAGPFNSAPASPPVSDPTTLPAPLAAPSTLGALSDDIISVIIGVIGSMASDPEEERYYRLSSDGEESSGYDESFPAHNVSELPLLAPSSVVLAEEGVHNGGHGSGSDGTASTKKFLSATVPADATPSGVTLSVPTDDGTASDAGRPATQEEHRPTPASAAQEPNETAQEPTVVVDGNVKQDLVRLLAESCDVFNNSKELRAGLADEINDCLAKLTDTQTLVSYLLADPPPRPDSEGLMDRVDEVMNRVPPFIWYLVDHITEASPECKIDSITQVLYSYVLTPEELCWVQVQATIARLEAVKPHGRAGKRSKRGVRGGTIEDPPSLEERVVDPESAEVVPPEDSAPADTISARPKQRGRRIRVLLLVENKRTGNPIPQLLDYGDEFPDDINIVFVGVRISDNGEGLQAIFLRREYDDEGGLEMVVIREDGQKEVLSETTEGAYVPVHSRFFIQMLLDVLDLHHSHAQTPN